MLFFNKRESKVKLKKNLIDKILRNNENKTSKNACRTACDFSKNTQKNLAYIYI